MRADPSNLRWWGTLTSMPVTFSSRNSAVTESISTFSVASWAGGIERLAEVGEENGEPQFVHQPHRAILPLPLSSTLAGSS